MHRLGKQKYYIMLLVAVFTWGIDPIVTSYLYRYYSAAALATLATFISAVMFLFLSRKKWHLWNRKYLTVALPICLANSLACILQRIGLQYTTPARYAFLEHLSCIIVPLLLFVCFRRKPNLPQATASILCLIGCLLLTGVGSEAFSFAIGDVLCSAAGLLLGLGIVLTAISTQGMDITLFTTVHMCTYCLSSASLMLLLNFIKVNGTPMEPIAFSFSPLPLLIAMLFGVFTIGVCWLLRNEATRHLHPSLVAVIAPFSAVITAAVSVIFGLDTLSPSFVIACVLIPLSAILSGLGDRPPKEIEAKPD